MNPFRAALVVLVAVTTASCARVDDPTLPLPPLTPSPVEQATVPEPSIRPEPNTCPTEGCRVTIQGIEDAGEELKLSFSSNYLPNISGNHFHVYWDRFEARQVSNDAASKHGVEQGEWEPTADNPFTTSGTVAVGRRAEAARICVTPGDANHNVIDPAASDCRDVAGFL